MRNCSASMLFPSYCENERAEDNVYYKLLGIVLDPEEKSGFQMGQGIFWDMSSLINSSNRGHIHIK